MREYIGVDLGTSAVKLVLMREDGAVLKTVSREYPLSFPHPGWSEQNPSDWLAAASDGIRELTASSEDASAIRGLSFGGQMHGLVILDENDEVIRPAILWNDGRTGEETDYLNHTVGEEKIAAYTNNIAFAGFTAPKILWLRKHEPENFARIRKIMLPKDYLAYKLTGQFVTDVSDASGTLLLDVKNRVWSEEMCRICGVSAEQLPALHESYDRVGEILPEQARALGLPEHVIVAAGAGDNAAAAVGTGTVGEGRCNISLGTSGTVFISSETFRPVSNHAVHFFDHADGSYHLMGCMLSAASCNKWWMDEIIGTKDYAAEQAKIGRLGENHVFFLPYLMGERSPHNNPKARGAFVGMTMDTSRAEMTQAVLEGVIFGLRDSIEIARKLGIQVTSTRICGGGAKSPLWRQMTADIIGIPVEVLTTEEGPGLGGAMLAAVADGVYGSVEEAAQKIVRVKETVYPDAGITAKYEQKYRVFDQIYPALKPVYDLL
ncbi:MAG: xylulokinase [Lachnospiraceae bacterium]|jgi:xylulokinase